MMNKKLEYLMFTLLLDVSRIYQKNKVLKVNLLKQYSCMLSQMTMQCKMNSVLENHFVMNKTQFCTLCGMLLRGSKRDVKAGN